MISAPTNLQDIPALPVDHVVHIPVQIAPNITYRRVTAIIRTHPVPDRFSILSVTEPDACRGQLLLWIDGSLIAPTKDVEAPTLRAHSQDAVGEMLHPTTIGISLTLQHWLDVARMVYDPESFDLGEFFAYVGRPDQHSLFWLTYLLWEQLYGKIDMLTEFEYAYSPTLIHAVIGLLASPRALGKWLLDRKDQSFDTDSILVKYITDQLSSSSSGPGFEVLPDFRAKLAWVAPWLTMIKQRSTITGHRARYYLEEWS